MMTRRNRLPALRKLTRTEGAQLLDRRARAELGISGEEFVRRWKAGRFTKNADRPELVRLTLLLPFAR